MPKPERYHAVLNNLGKRSAFLGSKQMGQEKLGVLAASLIDDISSENGEMSIRCKKLAAELFSSEAAVKQIIKTLYLVK